jgi:hypothetical protein
MILFALGVLLGAGCLAVYNELYTRWMYNDVKKRAKKQGISDEKMRAALMWATSAEIGKNLDGIPTDRR